MYKRFFLENNDNEQNAKEFADIVIKSGKPASAAQIQGYFMLVEDCCHKEIVLSHQKIWES